MIGLQVFANRRHLPESNAKRSVSMKRLYEEDRPVGMGFSRKYATAEEAKSAKVAQNRARQLKCRYGITLDDYDRMLQEQDGKCALCPATEGNVGKGTALHVDHNHETGEVRGLLCSPCNRAIAQFEDPDARFRMQMYIQRIPHDAWKEGLHPPKTVEEYKRYLVEYRNQKEGKEDHQ